MFLSRWTAFIAVVLFMTAGTMGAVSAGDGYEISMETAVEVPERTVENPENESQEFTITTVGRSTPGESALADVSPPPDTLYSVYFREENGNIVDYADRIQGDQQIEFNVGSEPAGSYVITAGESSAPDTVLPVVIEGYVVETLKMDGEPFNESTVTTRSSHSVTVMLTDQSDQSISDVTLTLWTEADGVVHETSLDATDGETATFEASLSDLSTGEYNAQVRIRGSESVNGEAELIGLSDNHPLTVEAPTDDSTGGTDGSSSSTDNDDAASGIDDGADGTTDEAENTSDTTSGNESNTTDGDEITTNSTADETSNTTSSDTTDGSANTNSSDASDSESATDTENASNSDDVIEPNTNTSNPTTDDSTPLHAVPLLLTFVVVIASVRRLLKIR